MDKTINDYYSMMDSVLKIEMPATDRSPLFNMLGTRVEAFQKGFIEPEVDLMYSQMIEDGYIQEVRPGNYKITLKGVLFWDNGNGGYVRKKQNDEQEIIRKARNEKLLRNYTLVLACGTIGLVLVEMTIHWDAFSSQILKWILCKK